MCSVKPISLVVGECYEHRIQPENLDLSSGHRHLKNMGKHTVKRHPVGSGATRVLYKSCVFQKQKKTKKKLDVKICQPRY